jgi:methoxymalonate biosynthesis protein
VTGVSQPGTLAVVGAGVMGTGIATLAAGHGRPVVLIDVDRAALDRAVAAVPGHLRLAQLLGKLPAGAATGVVEPATGLPAAAGAELVVEAVVEVPAVKAAVLAELSEVVGPQTPIVSNTSAIPIDELAGHSSHPERVAGAHFMNPPYLIRMVEVVRGPRTSGETMRRLLAVLATLDREGVVVGDGPGFVINRVLQRMINEAARIVSQGIADAETVDRLFHGCLGHATGPLATADLIGLDNVVDSLRVLRDRTGDPGYEPCQLLVELVGRGDLGRKSGRGFYPHPGGDRREIGGGR